MFVKSNDKVGDIIPNLVKLSDLPQDSIIDLYEVSWRKKHASTADDLWGQGTQLFYIHIYIGSQAVYDR